MEALTYWRATSPWVKTAGGFLVSLVLLVTLALFGWMERVAIVVALLPVVVGTGCALSQLIQQRDWWRLGLIAVLVLIPLINLWGETPSIFTGRDQGSIAEAAWYLAQTGALASRSDLSDSFFAIYGPGAALNFPGFAYTTPGSLTTQFPIGMTAWVAGFVSLLGLAGYALAIGCLLVLSGWSFFELASRFVRRPLAIIGTAFLVTTFLPVWMLHATLSEHLALGLFLILALALVTFLAKPAGASYTLVFLAGSLFLFTRIEGFVIGPIVAILILFTLAVRAWIMERPLLRLVLPLFALGFLFLRDFFINLPFYTVIAKVVAKHWHELTLLGTQTPASPSTGESLATLFTLYGLAPFFILGAVGIGLAFWKRQRQALIVIALALPTFAYLVDAHITPDHPWMLRRFFFTIWPTFVLGTLIAWRALEEKFPLIKTTAATLGLTTLLTLTQVCPLRVAWALDEYTSLFVAAQSLAEAVGDRDLVLVDRLASGSPYHLVAGPLRSYFGREAVYFFNPEDLDRLDLAPYNRVFYLGSRAAADHLERTLGRKLEEKQTFSFTLPTITIVGAAPIIQETTTQASLFEVIH